MTYPNNWSGDGPFNVSGSYELLKGIADMILSSTTVKPKLGLICGTGMGSLHELITIDKSIPYSKIPHFPQSTVSGHEGTLILGHLGKVPVICMKGRVHYYEGYTISQCVIPIRVMKLCGVTHLIISNAAGGLNKDFKVGDIMMLKDQINFVGISGVNPLRGPNDERWGPRFVATNNMYNKEMREMAKKAIQAVENTKTPLHEGVFAMVGGPNFETVAECRLLRTLGVDAVGMSTAHEALAAHHCGIKVFAFSLITNIASCEYDADEVNHDEVLKSGAKMETTVKKWLFEFIGLLQPSFGKLY